MTLARTFSAKKAFGIVTVVGICSLVTFSIKPFMFAFQVKSGGSQDPDNNEDAVSDSTTFQRSSITKTKDSEPLKLSSYKAAEERKVQRTQHVKNVCATTNETGHKDIEFAYSKKYNMACFTIPKIGSSFLKIMFMVLVYGKDNVSDIYIKARMKIHNSDGDIFHSLNASTIRDAFVVVPTRNPYTRLYSAYVDKVFLPISVRLAEDVGRVTREEGPCGRNQTFANFLNYALRSANDQVIEDHYGSPYKVVSSFLCSLNNYMLVQQETFSEDVELALLEAGVDKKDFDVIFDMLHDHRADATIPGIVKTIYAKSEPHEGTCYPRSEVARRTWKSFQIQGLLHSDINFPEHEFRSKTGKNLYADPDYVTQVILKYVRQRPMTSAESKAQRRASMLDAYKAVDKDILQKIHEMYAMDFEMYQYDTDVNSV